MAFGMAGRPKRRARLMAEGKWPPPGHGTGVSRRGRKSAPIRGSFAIMPHPLDKFDMDFWERNGMWDFDYVGEPDYDECDDDDMTAAEKRECREDAKAVTSTRGQAHLEMGGYILAVGEGYGSGITASVHRDSHTSSLGAAIKGVLSKTSIEYASMAGDARSIAKREKLGNEFLGKVQAEFLTWVQGKQIGSFLAGMF